MKTALSIVVTLLSLNAPAQDINNLVLPAGYPVIPLTSDLAADEYGSRTSPALIIIPGWGLPASRFTDLAQKCSGRFWVHVIHVPGHQNSAAYPSPAAGVSYGEQVWTNALVENLSRYIAGHKLHKPLVLAHFNTSTQVAIRLAINHPENVGGLLIACGPTALNLPRMPDFTLKQRIKWQDSIIAPKWFRTVSRETWNAGNYKKWFYSIDSVRADACWNAVADNSIPMMIQYLEEFNAQDTEIEIRALNVKTIVMIPDFKRAPADDPMMGMVLMSYLQPWSRVADKNKNVTVFPVSDSHAFVFLDRPDAVLEKLTELLR